MGLDVEHLAGETARSAGGYSFPLILPMIFVSITLALLHVYLQSRRIAKIGNKIPGPPTLPIIGNAHYVWNKTHNGKKKLQKFLKDEKCNCSVFFSLIKKFWNWLWNWARCTQIWREFGSDHDWLYFWHIQKTLKSFWAVQCTSTSPMSIVSSNHGWEMGKEMTKIEGLN